MCRFDNKLFDLEDDDEAIVGTVTTAFFTGPDWIHGCAGPKLPFDAPPHANKAIYYAPPSPATNNNKPDESCIQRTRTLMNRAKTD